MLRKFLALSGLLVACVGTGVFVAIGIWVWSLKVEVNRQAANLAARANAAGNAADHAVGFVREVIGRAESELGLARLHAADRPASAVNPFLQLTAFQVSHDLVGSVERAQGAVVAASDAVVVADAALDVVNEYPELKTLFGVSPDHVRETKNALASLTDELRKARGVLGVSGDGGTLTVEQLNAVEGALGQAKGFTDEMAKVVGTARGRVNDLKSEVEVWAHRVAVLTTAVCVLGVVGQLFLGRFCWRKLHHLPA